MEFNGRERGGRYEPSRERGWIDKGYRERSIGNTPALYTLHVYSVERVSPSQWRFWDFQFGEAVGALVLS